MAMSSSILFSVKLTLRYDFLTNTVVSIVLSQFVDSLTSAFIGIYSIEIDFQNNLMVTYSFCKMKKYKQNLSHNLLVLFWTLELREKDGFGGWSSKIITMVLQNYKKTFFKSSMWKHTQWVTPMLPLSI